MLADPRHSCVILINITRGAAGTARVSGLNDAGSVNLLPACRDIFGVACVSVGECEQAGLTSELAASIEHLEVEALSLWEDPRVSVRLEESAVNLVLLGGAFLEEEVLIAVLQGARQGYDIRLLSDLSFPRRELDGAVAIDRLAHHGIVTTTVRQALLEWAVCLGDQSILRKVQDLLAFGAPPAS